MINFKAKSTLLTIAVMMSSGSQAGIAIVDNEQGRFAIGGDVEFDFDYENKDSDASGESKDSYGQSGRVLIDFDALRTLENGNYLYMNVELLAGTDGDASIDNAFFAFGHKDSWMIKAGRYEAFDMFPKGQDTFVETTGNTSDDQYGEHGYFYQMKEARGRGGDSGQVMYAHQVGNAYFEVSALIGDRTEFFSADIQSSAGIVHENDSFYIRPVVSYQAGDFRLSGAIERQMISDSLTVNGKDIMDRTGYGVTGNFNASGWDLNASFAYMDAVDETNQSLGLSALYSGIGLGYFISQSDYEADHWAGVSKDGTTDIQSFYVSYEIADVLAVEDFSIYLGVYHSIFDDKDGIVKVAGTDEKDTGARIRLKYFF
jgi:hypothetical protein